MESMAEAFGPSQPKRPNTYHQEGPQNTESNFTPSKQLPDLIKLKWILYNNSSALSVNQSLIVMTLQFPLTSKIHQNDNQKPSSLIYQSHTCFLLLNKEGKMARLSRNGEKRVKKKKKPQFFTVIVNPALQLLKLRLPKKFVRNHGNNLPDCAYLRAPNGIDWLVEILKCDGEIWLQRGWKQFAEYYSLASGNVIVFKYNEKIRTFRVLIFDSNTNLEINYPTNHNLHQNAKEIEDDTSTEMFDEIQHQSEDKSSDECTEASALQRAIAFQSRNPNSFIAHIRNKNVSTNAGPFLPSSHCQRYYKQNDMNIRVVLHVNKNFWPIKCRVEKLKMFYISLTYGWKAFSLNNGLRTGDKCVFELMNVNTKIYNVHIFRASEEMIEQTIKAEEIIDDIPTEISGMKLMQEPAPKNRKLASSCNMKARAFVGDGPGFIINMSKSYIDLTPSVQIPAVHSKKFLKDEGKEHNVICIHGKDGRTWKLNYSFQESYPRILSSSWKKFRFDNHLKIGDKCAFKLIDGIKKAYNVVIFRIKGK